MVLVLYCATKIRKNNDKTNAGTRETPFPDAGICLVNSSTFRDIYFSISLLFVFCHLEALPLPKLYRRPSKIFALFTLSLFQVVY